MAHVLAVSGDVLALTGGESRFEIEAATVRRLVLALDERFPGLGAVIEKRVALAIDGEIHRNAWGAALKPDSEVVLIDRIGGG
jgi:hypothetical protein